MADGRRFNEPERDIMTEATLCFLDTETTGLDPDRHEIWEVGMIRRTAAGGESEHVWQLPVDLAKADPIALNIGRFHDRRWPEVVMEGDHRVALTDLWEGSDRNSSRCRLDGNGMGEWADEFVRLTRGAHLVGNVISFDYERLWKLLRRLGQCPMWHYHPIDVETLAAGHLCSLAGQVAAASGGDDDRINRANDLLEIATPPWDSDKLSEAFKVEVADDDRHTALGDARHCRDLYDAVTGNR